MLLVYATHESSCWGQNFVDEDEDGLLWREFDSLSDHVDKLTDCQIGWDQVLLLIDGGDIRLLDLLADDLL